MTDIYRYPEHTPNDASIDRTTVELCENCVLAQAGYDPWEGRERDEREYDICPEWDGWIFDPVYADDDPDHEYEPLHGFSWAICDGCHSTLGGERYTHTAVLMKEQK